MLAVLQDGQWHYLSDLAKQLRVSAEKLKLFVEFLDDQGIVDYEVKTPRVKMEQEWIHLFPIEGETEIERVKR